MLSADRLKRMIYVELKQSGFKFKRNELVPPNLESKWSIRRTHKPAKMHLLLKNKNWIFENEKAVLDYFADGGEVIPEEISPKLVLVDDLEKSNLFRYASYLWSVPLSSGFGRRLRYLVMDKNNNKLIGIIGLTDPVIGLKVRDDWIGWTKEQKEKMLWHVMDAYAFGAVKPYSYLLGGKLVATLAISDQVRKDFKKKYSHGRSVITNRNSKSRKAHLVLITTTGAFGESSILDRLKTFDNSKSISESYVHDKFLTISKDPFLYKYTNGQLNIPMMTMGERPLWHHIGFTEGWGFFHLNNGISTQMYEYLKWKHDPIVKRHRFGQGPNWKMRLLRHGMTRFGLDYKKYGKHGIKRGFYASPLAKNFKEFLKGEDKKPKFYKQSTKELFDFFKVRYLLPRAERDFRWKLFSHQSINLSKTLKSIF